MEIHRYSSGTRWEAKVGYARVVRAGPFVEVSGTTATGEDGELVGGDDAHAQTRQALHNVERALNRAGADLSQVTRTRLYATDIDRWREIGRAHREAFGETPPATSLVEVARLVDPAMLVEVEARAWIGGGERSG